MIQQLPNPLRDAICVFYLVLRALDTVEDDMAVPDATKLPALYSFHEKIYERSVFTYENHCKQSTPSCGRGGAHRKVSHATGLK